MDDFDGIGYMACLLNILRRSVRMPVLLLRMAKNEKNKYATANMPTLTIAKLIEMNSILSRVSLLGLQDQKSL